MTGDGYPPRAATVTPMSHPALLPGLRLCWRDRHHLQAGLDPEHALVVEFPVPALAGVLPLLDGSRTEERVAHEAAALGIPAEAVSELLAELSAAGLVVPAHTLLPDRMPRSTLRRLAAEIAGLALTGARGLLPGIHGDPAPNGPFRAAGGDPAASAREESAREDSAHGVDGRRDTGARDGTAAGAPGDLAEVRHGHQPDAPPMPADQSRPGSPAVPADLPGPDDPAGSGRLPGFAEVPVPAGPTPAEALRRRASARVLVRGHSRLATPIAVTLACSGVGHVSVAVDGRTQLSDSAVGGVGPGDAARLRTEASVDAVLRAAPGTVVTPLAPERASVIVQAGHAQPARLAALAGARLRGATLSVDVREGVALVGPLVPPSGSPCLHCLDLHRLDRDAAWPRLAAHLASGPDAVLPCTATTALAAAAYAADEVLAFVDRRTPRTLGATVEISAPGAQRRRSWVTAPGV